MIATGLEVKLHPSSVLHGRAPECVVFNEVIKTTRQYVRGITKIEKQFCGSICSAFALYVQPPATFVRQVRRSSALPQRQTRRNDPLAHTALVSPRCTVTARHIGYNAYRIPDWASLTLPTCLAPRFELA